MRSVFWTKLHGFERLARWCTAVVRILRMSAKGERVN
jgi:hypothetical protein